MPSISTATFSRETSLGYQVNHLARLMEAALRARIAPYGVVPGQFAQLLALYEHDGVSQSELCRLVRIDQSTMAHTLKRMDRDGLVRRTADPHDARRSVITVTPSARELRDDLTRAAESVNARARAGIGDADFATCLDVLGRLIDNLERDHGEDDPR